ncbi:MAG TPA: pitrilysin family protein [Candidatus Eisenbacteria bacterium]|nr:pitrilysin family protein [Candidatus Eisenbacteria bacterium]
MRNRRVSTAARRVASMLALLAAMAGGRLAEAQSIRLPEIRDLTLPSGARVLLAERHDVPLVAMSAFLRGGGQTDPEGKEGLGALTAEMLRKGAGARSASQIADALDGVGAAFATGAGMETFYVTGEFMKGDVDLMIDLAKDVLRNPTFPDSEFVKLRSQTVEGLLALKDDPGNVYRAYGGAYFYGAHPYGRPVGGDEATVAALTREDVLRCYRDQFGGDRLIFVVVGDFAASAMEAKIRAAFGDWRKAAAAHPVIPAPERVGGRRVLIVDKADATQTYFWIGNRGVSATDPDRDVLDVANTAFGGTFASLLNSALRIKSGLTYGASCRLQRLTAGGAIGIGSYTKTESTAKAIDLALLVLRDFRTAGLQAEKLSAGRNYINGQFPTDLETAGQLAGALAANAFYGLGREEITGYPARIAAVDSAAVYRAVTRVYPPDKDLVLVMVGNAAKLRAVAKRYGPVSEIPLSRPMIEALRSVRAGGAGASAR